MYIDHTAHSLRINSSPPAPVPSLREQKKTMGEGKRWKEHAWPTKGFTLPDFQTTLNNDFADN